MGQIKVEQTIQLATPDYRPPKCKAPEIITRKHSIQP